MRFNGVGVETIVFKEAKINSLTEVYFFHIKFLSSSLVKYMMSEYKILSGIILR